MNTTYKSRAPVRGHCALLAARHNQSGDLQEKPAKTTAKHGLGATSRTTEKDALFLLGANSRGPNTRGRKYRDKRTGQIYLTALLAGVPVAVAAILASPAASPANVQLSLNATHQNAVLMEIVPLLAPCRWPVGDAQIVCPGSTNKKKKKSDSDSGRQSDQGSHPDQNPDQ